MVWYIKNQIKLKSLCALVINVVVDIPVGSSVRADGVDSNERRPWRLDMVYVFTVSTSRSLLLNITFSTISSDAFTLHIRSRRRWK